MALVLTNRKTVPHVYTDDPCVHVSATVQARLRAAAIAAALKAAVPGKPWTATDEAAVRVPAEWLVLEGDVAHDGEATVVGLRPLSFLQARQLEASADANTRIASTLQLAVHSVNGKTDGVQEFLDELMPSQAVALFRAALALSWGNSPAG